MMQFDLVIRGGQVFDGMGGDAVEVDVAVCGDRVEAVGPLRDAQARRVIDAAGLCVCPGFIDIHAHGDLYPLLCPEAPARLLDGVTAEVLGNCGESPFPQTPEMLSDRAESFERYGIRVDWATFDDYARCHDEVRCGINRASLVGHGNVRAAVMGEGDRAPTQGELEAMKREIEAGLDAGAFGFSTGLIYAPGMYARPEEIEALCEVVARRGALYASHIRGEGDSLEGAVEEFVHVGRRTGCRLQLSHVKASGPANWWKAEQVIAKLHAVRAEGVDLACDRYPYIAAATSLSSQLPGWAREGGRDRMLARMSAPETRGRIVQELWKSAGDEAEWGRIVIADAASDAWRRAEGRSLLNIAAEARNDPVETLLDVLADGEGRTSIVILSMCEENLVKWLSLPFVAIGSDSTSRSTEGPTASGKPHPRSYGTFCRVLGRYVREQRVLTLPEAIRRMTSLPASRLGLKRRGTLRPGAAADITVFDADAVGDRATYAAPHQYSTGVRCVLVNGAVAVEDGKLTGARNGRFLRRGEE